MQGARKYQRAMRALIVAGADERGSLAAARGLARAGWTVGVGSPGGLGLAAASKFAGYRHDVPSPVDGIEQFVLGVRRAVDERDYAVVLAGGDAEMLALSAARDQLQAVVPWSSHRSLELVLDKLELARLATRAGLRAPWTAEATPEALRMLDGRPLVVKPRVPVVENRHRLFETVIASGPVEAEQRVRRLRSEGFVPLLQEHVRGRLIALILVIGRRGEVLARVQQRALRLHPPHAGVSARAETVAVDEQLAARAHRLLSDIGWFGLAQLQLLQSDDGEPCLVDLNGRFYGSLALALAAGSNLPALWAAAAIGRPVDAIGDPLAGVRYQWLGGELANSRAEPVPARLRALAAAARYGVGAAHSVWALSDPGPSMRVLASHARRLAPGP